MHRISMGVKENAKTRNYYAIFPCPSYDKFYNIKFYKLYNKINVLNVFRTNRSSI